MLKVVEVSYTVPPEVFIRRHVEALRGAPNLEILLVGRSPDRGERPASAAQGPLQPYERVMPNFDHIGLPQKVWSLRHALRRAAWRDGLLLRDRAVLGFFDSLEPDLIHFHMASLAVLMRWIPQALGIPYTVSLRGSDVQVEPLVNAEYRRLLRDALTEATAIHCVSHEIMRTGQRWAEGRLPRCAVIYTAVPRLRDARRGATLAPGDRFVVATVGRLHWTKGLEYGLMAIRRLASYGFKVLWRIVGDGPSRLQLEYAVRDEGLEDIVRLEGSLAPDAVLKVLSQCHVYFHPAVAEGISNALVEAMAVGLPVVATDVGGTREVLEDGVQGFLVPVRDWRRMADALHELARDAALRWRLGEAAQKHAAERFSFENHRRAFLNFYRQILPGDHACGADHTLFSQPRASLRH